MLILSIGLILVPRFIHREYALKYPFYYLGEKKKSLIISNYQGFVDFLLFLGDPSGLCESGIILLIINLLPDIIEKQCTTVCTTFSALFWRAKLP